MIRGVYKGCDLCGMQHIRGPEKCPVCGQKYKWRVDWFLVGSDWRMFKWRLRKWLRAMNRGNSNA